MKRKETYRALRASGKAGEALAKMRGKGQKAAKKATEPPSLDDLLKDLARSAENLAACAKRLRQLLRKPSKGFRTWVTELYQAARDDSPKEKTS